jgi:hypothetical protein
LPATRPSAITLGLSASRCLKVKGFDVIAVRHVRSDADPGHRWLRTRMSQAVQAKPR